MNRAAHPERKSTTMKISRLIFLIAIAIAATFVIVVAVTPDPFDPEDQAGAAYRASRANP